jgi:hypothetical protein
MIRPHPRDSAPTNMRNNPQPTNRPISAHKKRDRAAEGEEREEYPAPVFLSFYSLLFFCQQKIRTKFNIFLPPFLVLCAHLSSDQEYLLQPRPTNWSPGPYVFISMEPNAKCPLGRRVLRLPPQAPKSSSF